eukprot:TRINITY_DN7368_c0_g1_i4.p1 TRINITY_DN7368_c0_g1~~TRINITY_DN7368_c0_g1_i4.p1  ORF type:complete len:281 (+),score=23.06 TRINITY_DN7368_c0_g1_i4:132-974(+)
MFKLGKANWEKIVRQINILERTPRGCNHYFKFLSREDLPVNFNKLGKRKKSDCLRLALLKRHGGIWIDTSILLIQHLDSFVQFENSQPKNLAGFYLRAYGSEKYNYTDFFESWFIAANKNSPLLERWQQIFNEYQSTAWKDDEKIKIQDHYLFNNLDLSNFVRYGNDFRDYLSIHVAFRKAIEENPEYFYNNVSLKEADSSAYFIPSFIEAWDGKQIQEILLSKSYEKDNKDFLTEILKQPLLKFNSGIYSQINKLNRSQLLDKGTIIGKLYSQLLHGQF